jgi:hypothetical protein
LLHPASKKPSEGLRRPAERLTADEVPISVLAATAAVAQFRFMLVAFDRIKLRDEGSEEFSELNALGKQGWRIVHVKEDPQNNRDLLFFMEREER